MSQSTDDEKLGGSDGEPVGTVAQFAFDGEQLGYLEKFVFDAE